MKAIILAAGYAVRLYPLTKEYPKPLLCIGKRPIINYIIDQLEKIEEIDEIFVVTNSKFISRFRKWRKEFHWGKKISLLDDLTKSPDDRLGAIGDMNFAIEKKRLNDDVLVIGGDNLFDGNLSDFLFFAKTHKSKPVIGAFDIKILGEAKKYGVIKLDKENKVIDFKEKPESPRTTLVAMCVYFFPKAKLGLIQQYLKKNANKRDATGFYIDWLRKKEPVYGFIFARRWFDIGQRKVYDEVKKGF